MEKDNLPGYSAEKTRKYPERVTTDTAARALGVTPRTVRIYIEQGKLEAISQGEGVEKTWLVSVESLEVLKNKRNNAVRQPRGLRETSAAEIDADNLFREVTARLEIKAAEIGEIRARLAMVEQAESVLKEERQRLIRELEREGRRADQEHKRAEEAQRTAERLVQEYRQAREESRLLREELEAERGKGFWQGLFGS